MNFGLTLNSITLGSPSSGFLRHVDEKLSPTIDVTGASGRSGAKGLRTRPAAARPGPGVERPGAQATNDGGTASEAAGPAG